MTDVHCHILHSIDDGPKSLEESIALVRSCANDGIKTMVSTSHYYSAHTPLEDFVDRRDRRIAELKSVLPENGINMDIRSAAEIHITEILLNLSSMKELCIENTSFALLEIPYNEADMDRVCDLIERIVSYYCIKPIIAHVERYDNLVKNEAQVLKFRSMGCLIQVDSDSMIQMFGKDKRFVSKLIKHGLVDLIASDCHGGKRIQNLPKAYENIAKRFSPSVVDALQKNAARVLEDKPVSEIIGRY